jgi:NitT/TauT family transport system substrate-binding protein
MTVTRWGIAILAALVLAALAAAGTPAASSQGPAPVAFKLALPGAAVAAAPVYLARDRGYFAAQGLNVDLENFASSAEMVPALATGEVLAAIGAASPGIYNAVRRGIEIKIVADAGSTPTGAGFTAMVVRRDLYDSGAIRDFPDLRGRRIAVPSRASTSLIDVDRALSFGGLTLADIDVVELPFADMNAALASRNLDAAMQIDPLVAAGVARDLIVRWKGSDELYPGHQIALIMFSPRLSGGQADLGRRFLTAYLRGARDYADTFFRGGAGRADVVQILINNTPVKDAALYDQMAYANIDPNGALNEASMAQDIDWWVQLGLMPERVDLSTVIDRLPAQQVVQQLGPY